MSVGPRVTMAPIHLAEERGFFRDEGMAVVFQEAADPIQALTLLGGGSVDVALFSFVPALPNAVVRGARIRVVAGRDSTRPGCSDQGALYYRRAKFPNGVEQRADWANARIALSSPTATAEFYFDTLLQTLGIPAAEVQPARMTMEEAVAGTVAGRVDAFFGSGRPNLMDAGLPDEVVRTDLLERTLGEFQYSYVIFGSRLLDGDDKTGTAFLRAYLRAVRAFVAGDTPKFIDDFARRMKLNAEALRTACRNNIALDGEVRMPDLQRWLSWSAEKGYLPSGITAEQIVDMRFQREAQRASLGVTR